MKNRVVTETGIFCPFSVINEYIKIRGDFSLMEEQFFHFFGMVAQ